MPGLIGAVARTAVAAGTWTAVSNRVSHRQAERWAREDQAAYAQPVYVQQAPPAPMPAPAPAAVDPLEQLKKLAQLRDSGVLTEEEFKTQKAKILAG